MGQTERLRHIGVHLAGHVPEVVQVLFGKDKRLQLGVRLPFADLWHQVHVDSSRLGESPAGQIPTHPGEKSLAGGILAL